jgi:hypothetical protein
MTRPLQPDRKILSLTPALPGWQAVFAIRTEDPSTWIRVRRPIACWALIETEWPGDCRENTVEGAITTVRCVEPVGDRLWPLEGQHFLGYVTPGMSESDICAFADEAMADVVDVVEDRRRTGAEVER